MHDHAPGDTTLGPLPPSVRSRLVLVVVPFIIATIVGLVLLWPSHAPIEDAAGYTADSVTGTVIDIHGCDPTLGLPDNCLSGTVQVSDSDGGTTVEAGLPYGASAPTVERGDRVVLLYAPDAPEGSQYVWSDFDRTNPMLILVLVFVVAVIFLSRWEGVGSLFALGLSLAVVFVFILPALSHGENPTLTAVTGASFILIVALYATHGISAMTTVAVIGTLLALAVTALLGLGFTELMHFTGLSDESNRFVFNVLPHVQFEGLLLAGLIIGALGVLDDVTVTQAAAVWELAALDRRITRPALFASAMRIGRAHVSATVNTLVLAYAGAALPLLLTYSAVQKNTLALALTDGVSQEIVRGLVGSLGIIAAVPITTAVAVAVAAAIVNPGYRSHRG
jgi:uncharacterized membrane protein